MEDLCDELGIPYEKTYANFMLIKTGKGAEITQKLTEQGVIVRPMAPYGLEDWIRVSLGTMDENRKFAAALREIYS